jgi:FdhD protein
VNSNERHAIKTFRVERHARGEFSIGGAPSATEFDAVVVEEPLEIRVAGEALATTMRTPGNDEELVAGFLRAEGIIASVRDVGSIVHCGRPGEEGYGNVVDVASAPGTTFDVDRTEYSRRGTLTTSACGVCGRRTVNDLVTRLRPVEDAMRFDVVWLQSLTQTLSKSQRVFSRTGGLHAAGIATENGDFVCVHEDVGRHNAVDKVVGRLLLDDRLPATGHALVVSGRASFEIVAKAVAASIPLVVAVSAPSSLAIETAERAGVTLIGFARDSGFVAYAHAERLQR